MDSREPQTAAGRRFVDRHGTGKQSEVCDIEAEAARIGAQSVLSFGGSEAAEQAVRDADATIQGNADLHSIAEFTVERQHGQPVPNVSIRCQCNRVYELDEYPGHIGAVIAKALRERRAAAVREAALRPLIDAARDYYAAAKTMVEPSSDYTHWAHNCSVLLGQLVTTWDVATDPASPSPAAPAREPGIDAERLARALDRGSAASAETKERGA